MVAVLRSDGVNDVASLRDASDVQVGSISNAGGSTYVWWIKGTLRAAPTGVCGLLGSSAGSTSNGFVTNATLQLRVYTAGTNRYGTGDNFFEVGVYHHYRLEHDAGGAWRIYRDNMVTPVASGTFTTSTNFARLDQMFRSSNSSAMYAAFDLEEMGIESSTFTETYQASLSGGTGNILPTVSGNNKATLVNFPTDNSQWIGFGGGGTAQDITVSNAETLQQAQQAIVSTTQAITVNNAETLQQAQQAVISTTQAIAVSNAETLQQAQQVSVGVSQAIEVSIAQQLTEAQQVTITQGGAVPGQDIVVLTAEQRTEAVAVTVSTNQNIVAGSAETLQQSQQVVISTSQQVLTNNAQQLTEAQQVTITQGAVPLAQDIVVLTAEQRTEAQQVSITTGQNIVVTTAQQDTQAEPAVVSMMQQIMVSVAQQLTQGVIAGEVSAQPIIAAKVKVTLKPSRFTISIVN